MAPKSHKKKRVPAPKRTQPRVNRVATRSVARHLGNEASYVKALFAPFDALPARFPDMLSQGTAVTSSTVRFVATSVADSGDGNFYTAVTVWPHVGSTTFASNTPSGAKAAQNVGFVSGVASPSPGQVLWKSDPLRGGGGIGTGAVYANWASYRTVAMGLRITNVTPVLNRGGLCGMRSIVGRTGDALEYPSVNDALRQRNTTVWDAASTPPHGEVYSWLPNNYTDLSFLPTSDTNFTPALQFFWSGTAAQSFEIEIRTMYEFRPLEDVQYLFNQASARGSPAKAEAMVSEVSQAAGDPSSPGFFQRAAEIADKTMSAGEGASEAVLHLAREAYHLPRRAVQGVLQPFR